MLALLHLVSVYLRLLSMEPREATELAAVAAGSPGFAAELVSICKRESPGHDCSRRVSIHHNDPPKAVRSFYRKATARGWIDPVGCELHAGLPMTEFAVRGSHGLAAAYSLHYLGPCVSPAALDIPYFSAYAATMRAAAMCRKHSACDRDQRHRLWRGQARPEK